jgi:hypothetical protein
MDPLEDLIQESTIVIGGQVVRARSQPTDTVNTRGVARCLADVFGRAGAAPLVQVDSDPFNGAKVAALLIDPVMVPPRSKSKFFPEVTEPAVTETAVAAEGDTSPAQYVPSHAMLSNHSLK